MFRNDFPLTVVFFSAILSAMLVSCAPYSDSRHTLAMADSLDAERKLYSDTAALTTAIESMDNIWGKVVAREMLAKAYYYRGRNYERNKEQVCAAAADYICCDKLRPNNDELRGRANSCMAYICALQEDYKLACVYCTRALDYLEETEKKYYYAHALLNMCSCELNGGDMERADELWREAETYTQTMDSAFRARLLGVRGSYYLAAQMHDSALYYLEQIPLKRLTPHQQAYYEKQKMLCYYAKGDNDRAEEFAKRVIENSNEASYLAQAYSTLLYIHIQDDSLNVPVEYARPRIAAEKKLRTEQEKYTAAVEQLRTYSTTPYPYLPWLTVVILMGVIGLVLVGVLYFAIYNFRLIVSHKDKTIHHKEQQIVRQKEEHQEQIRSIEQQYVQENVSYLHQVSLFLSKVETIRSTYPEPPARWQQLNNLYYDTKPVFSQFAACAREHKLTDRETTYCIYLILYKDVVSKQIAEYMCYSPTGIGTLKQRVSHKLGCSAADLYETCLRLAVKAE